MVYIFRKGKFESFALTEAKLKGNGEISCCGVNRCIVYVDLFKDLPFTLTGCNHIREEFNLS